LSGAGGRSEPRTSERRKRLLILARAEDETARRFASFARANGVVAVVAGPGQLALTLLGGRDGRAEVRISSREPAAPFDAVLNRGFATEVSEAERFPAAETLAAWWAALAEFPGPVVNRPGPRAFVPELDATGLARRAGLAPSERTITTMRAAVSESHVNVYRVDDGTHVGLVAPGGTAPCDGEVYRHTRFDPGQAAHAVVAGPRLIPLAPAAPLEQFVEPLERLREAVLAAGANFAYIVFVVADELLVAHASAFPLAGQYASAETAVHGALLAYLTSG
jgi:hypothetical protein